MDKNRIINILDQGINWLFLSIIFIVPVYFAYWQETYNVFDINKVTVARIGISLILFLWLAKAALEAKIFYYRRGLLVGAGLILLVYVFNGVIFSIKPQLSFWGNYERQQGVYSLLYYWLFFILLISWLRNWRQVKSLLWAVVASSFFVCAYGIAQKFGLDPMAWSKNEGRIFSSLGQPNFLGHYLVIIIPLTIYSIFFVARKRWSRILLSLVVIMQGACLLYTLSRSAWLGFLAASAVSIVLWTWIKGKKRLMVLAVVSLALLIVGLKTVAQYQTFSYTNRFASIFSLDSVANKTRLFYWQSAKDIWWQTDLLRKIIGYGKDTQASNYLGQYRPEWGIYETINSFPDRVHNSLLDALLEFGLSGLAVFLIFNVYLVWQALKYLHKNKLSDGSGYWVLALLSSLAAYGVADLFGFALTTQYLYYYLIVGWLCLVIFKQEIKFFSLSGLSLVFRWVVTTALIIFVSFFLYFFTVGGFVADVYFMKAKQAEAEHDCLGAMDNVSRAVDWQSLNLYYKEQYIFMHNNCFPALTSQTDMIAVLNNILEQVDAYPESEYGYHIVMNMAHAYSIFGYYVDKKYYTRAEEAYLKLIAFNPGISVDYQDYGRMKAWAGEYRRAIEIYKQGLKAAPPLEHPDMKTGHYAEAAQQVAYLNQLIAQAYVKLGDLDQALEYYLKVERLKPDYIMIYDDIAKVYQAKNEPAQAIAYFKKGLTLAPTDVAWSFNLALYYKQLGRWREAWPYAQEALRLSPTDRAIIQLTQEIKEKVK
jgi:putative inorganic carbon (HCO3(-)) transporter